MVKRYFTDGDDFESWFQEVGSGSQEPGLAYQYVKYLEYEGLLKVLKEIEDLSGTSGESRIGEIARKAIRAAESENDDRS